MPVADLPRLGLGTFSPGDPERWADTVRTALELGYRHIDTAELYGNEAYIGRGIAAADVDRSDVFLATKTVHVDVPPSVDRIGDAIDGCLERLGVEYVDLLYVHWPSGIYDHETVLPVYDEAYAAGKTRYVGLSNFTPDLLEEAREVLEAPLLAHQVEMHPLLHQDALLEYAQTHDLWLVAYAPLGNGAILDDPVLTEIAAAHGVSPAQVCLAWLLSKEHVAAIPKASSEAHLRENLAARDVRLDPAAIERIDGIERTHRAWDPEYAPWNR